jgi:hypothetical protein
MENRQGLIVDTELTLATGIAERKAACACSASQRASPNHPRRRKT